MTTCKRLRLKNFKNEEWEKVKEETMVKSFGSVLYMDRTDNNNKFWLFGGNQVKKAASQSREWLYIAYHFEHIGGIEYPHYGPSARVCKASSRDLHLPSYS